MAGVRTPRLGRLTLREDDIGREQGHGDIRSGGLNGKAVSDPDIARDLKNMTRLTLYGLPNCDTCRKARKALEADGHTVTLRDIRADPPDAAEWAQLLSEFGDALINRRSTTWRGLSEEHRAAAPDALLATHPALMKRPVLSDGVRMTLGWDDATRSIWK
jgi:Spx/MgsR family transcriptional regulator